MRPSSIYEQIVEKHPNSFTAQIITLDAHCSNLQARLLTTLDALDDLQRSHRVELDELHRRIAIRRVRSAALKARTKVAEAERDTLREGVNELIAKVEFPNDHRVLPHSGIYLPYPLEPCATALKCESHSIPGSTETILNALVSSLTNQLTVAKNTYADLKEMSDAKIATLEAKVARRDTELEAYRPYACSCYPHGQVPVSKLLHKGKNQPSSLHSVVPLSKEVAFRILEETATRQRELQANVDVLAHKLSAAQLAKPDQPSYQSLDVNHNVIPNSSATSNPTRPPSVPTMGAIDRQLVHPEQAVHESCAEQDNAAVFATHDQGTEQKSQQNQAEFKEILLLEQECIRLRKSECTLQKQLLLASTNEQDLRAKVEQLQRQLSGNDLPTPEPMAIDGETDMDISDPTIEELTARSSTPLSQPTGQAPSPSPPSLSSSRLAHIESELRLARTDVESKERDIDTLRAQVASLKKLIQTEDAPLRRT